MASTSSSKKYDVFINHRGPDVKRTLASCIYNMLDFVGVPTFLDQEELEKGDPFPPAIEEAIQSASVHIAIFSPRYAESCWCLNELVLMLQTNATLIPVFYDVQPSDLRHVQKGMYADWFRQHEKKRQQGGELRYTPQQIKKWKKALRSASDLTGFVADGDKCDQGELMRKIVETAVDKLKKVSLEVAMFPVGLEEAVQNFESKVGSSTGSQNVHIVGIVGMGGSGKTTLSKVLYNKKCFSISRSCFLSNVRDAASKNTLLNLQQNILKDLRIEHSAFHNIDQGIGMLGRCLSGFTVLIVLDDVDHKDQIDALLPHRVMHNLGKGSFIIVTTREVDVLESSGISCIYNMKMLDTYKAKQLFSRHAFSQPYSQDGFEHIAEKSHKFQDLIERFVDACNGLPLSLKVLGAMVNGKSRAYWESKLDKISRILPEDIADCLKVSYDALDSEQKQMFLDVACFFIGGEKSRAVAIWDGSEWSGEDGWVTLVNKCLVELDDKGSIWMHDHLRDLGRQIAGDVTPHRIWKEEQISIQEGRTPIRGILVGLSCNWFENCPPPLEDFMKEIINRQPLPKLQLLNVVGNDFREEFKALSRHLVWLRWHRFEGTSLPSWLSLANLRVLELYDPRNLEQLWQDNDNVQLPLLLRELIIDGCGCFERLPSSTGLLRHLKKLVLNSGDGCEMRRLPEGFCHLTSLEVLQLWAFCELSSLPDDLGKLLNLRSLCLGRLGLTALPDSFKQLTALQTLKIEECYSFMFTSEMLDDLKFMTQLQLVRIETLCPEEELPQITTAVSSAWECNLNTLKTLYLRGTGVRRISISDDCCPTLEELTLIDNHHLTEIETLPGNVRQIDVQCCEKLKNMRGIGGLRNLKSLEVFDCPYLEELPCPEYMYSVGHTLSIRFCPLLEMYEDDSNSTDEYYDEDDDDNSNSTDEDDSKY